MAKRLLVDFFLMMAHHSTMTSSQHPGDKVNSWSIWEMYLGYRELDTKVFTDLKIIRTHQETFGEAELEHLGVVKDDCKSFHDTPWKFNIAPGNWQSQKETHLPTIIFRGYVKLPGCTNIITKVPFGFDIPCPLKLDQRDFFRWLWNFPWWDWSPLGYHLRGICSATFFSNNRSCVQNPRDAAELEEVTGLVAYILDQSMYMSGHFHLSFPGV